MADLSQLSNEEIRAQLLGFGYQVGPVTVFSRNVYIKRLRQLMLEHKGKYSKPRRNVRLSGLSSGEDSDGAERAYSDRSTRKKKKSPQVYYSSNASPTNSRSAEKTKGSCTVNAFRVPVIRSARRLVGEIGPKDAREYLGTGVRYREYLAGFSSESDERAAQNEIHARRRLGISDSTSNYRSRLDDSHEKVLSTEGRTSWLFSSLRSLVNPFGSLMTALGRRSHVAGSHTENNGFIPHYRRLSNMDRHSSRNLDIFLTTEDRNWFSRNCQAVPKTLVLIVLLFFLGLAISYAALVKSFRSETGNNYPICMDRRQKALGTCVEKRSLPAAINLIKAVHPYIEERSLQYACNSLYGNVAPEKILISRTNLLDYLEQKHPSYGENDVKNMEILIASNPHWGIALNREYGEEILYVSTPLRAPVKCYSKYLLYWLVDRLIQATFCVVVVLGLLKMLLAYKAYADTHKRNVRGMVARITQLLRAEYDSNAEESSFVVIDYMRDRLISPHDRKRMELVWTSAVNFIRHNDPRIKEETRVVKGELKTVWRWLPDPGSSACEQPQNSSQGSHPVLSNDKIHSMNADDTTNQQKIGNLNHRSSRMWQGQAFETMAGSPNSVPCSPTPCLKIRHMFDPDAEHGEDWPTFIRDTILEKCEGVPILHLFVDKTSREGCVYVKCRTPEDAGRAYCNLHGWWFGNSHLVTVKYLRVERYHERFPEAVNATTVLKPSSNQRLSLGD